MRQARSGGTVVIAIGRALAIRNEGEYSRTGLSENVNSEGENYLMTDNELLALTALVNDQAIRMAYVTARAQALREEPIAGYYSDVFVDRLVKELESRKLFD